MASLKARQQKMGKKIYLPENHKLAESIINTIRELLIVLDNDLKVISASRSFYEFFKVTPEETVGQLIYDLGNWDIPNLRELLEDILPQKSTFDNYEVEHNFTTIGQRTMVLNARQIQKASGQERIILLAIEDITERKRLQKELKESEERFRRAFETSHDALLLIHKTKGDILNSNASAQELLEYSTEEFLKNKLWDIGMVKNFKDFKETVSRLEIDNIMHFKDTPVRNKKGQSIDTEVFLMDRAKVVQCNIRNITERKKAKEELEKSEIRFKELFNHMDSGVAIYEAVENGNDFVIKNINDSGCVLSNVSREHVLGKRITEAFPGVEEFGLLSVLQKAYKTGKPKRYPAALYTDKNLTSWFDNYVYKLPSGIIVAIYDDVTSSKQYEIDILESRGKMEKLSGKLHLNLIGTVTALANTVEYRDRYTVGHSRNVSDLACAIAVHMGLQTENVEALKMAGFLHDIGKIAVPLETLVKPSPLTKEEFNVIKTHPLIGYQLVKPVEFPLPVAKIILEHHERLNGSGYPYGKRDNELLLESKIIAVADVVEAMSLERPYRKALGIKKALKEITKHKGVLFDSEIVDTCVRIFEEKEFKFRPPPKEPEFTLETIEGCFE